MKLRRDEYGHTRAQYLGREVLWLFGSKRYERALGNGRNKLLPRSQYRHLVDRWFNAAYSPLGDTNVPRQHS